MAAKAKAVAATCCTSWKRMVLSKGIVLWFKIASVEEKVYPKKHGTAADLAKVLGEAPPVCLFQVEV